MRGFWAKNWKEKVGEGKSLVEKVGNWRERDHWQEEIGEVVTSDGWFTRGSLEGTRSAKNRNQ